MVSTIAVKLASSSVAVFSPNKKDYSSSVELNTLECSMRDIQVSLHYASRSLNTRLTKIGLIPKLTFLLVDVA